MAQIKLIALLLLAFVLALFCVALNPNLVLLELGVVTLQIRQGVLLVLVLIIGLLIGVALQAKWIAELLAERGRLRRALKAAETKSQDNQSV